MSDRLENLFIFGLGYTGLRFVAKNGSSFSSLSGTVRSPEKAASLQATGVYAYAFDSAEAIDRAIAAEAVLVSVPPDISGDPVFMQFGERLAKAGKCRWLGYLSTTGVYGDRDGAWTDETVPVHPVTPYSMHRADAERDWQAWGAHNNIPTKIFRLTGIYGPGRSAFDTLERGEARRIIKPGQVFNRIHVDDIVAVLMASLAQPEIGTIYNVSDDEPAPPQDVITYAAKLAGMVPPPEVLFDDADLSPVGRSFYSENKRIDNRLMKRELGIKLAYPTYREGLAALLQETQKV